MLYKLKNITQVYETKTILDIPGLEIEKGLIYSLSGPNGAGKSTLLNILGFLDKPSTGTMEFYGNPVCFNEKNLQELRRRVILLDQHPILFTTTVFKNLEFGLKLRKITKSKREKIITENLELVGLGHFRHEQAVNLSGGEIQRVALARILALTPEVLLCDEPTSSVDTENRNRIVNLLKRINREKQVSIIFTSHDTQHTALLADRVLYLSHGNHITGGHENIFQAHMDSRNGKPVINIENTLFIPGEKGRKGIFKVSLVPEKIKISDTHSESGIPAKIIRLTKENNGVRAEADAGIMLTLILSQDEYENRNLIIGSDIFLEISKESVLLSL